MKGCATPDFCNLEVNTTLGPEASGFHLTTGPECNYRPPPTQPGALNPDFLRLYPLCPPWISLVLPNPVCSQGIPIPPTICSFQGVQLPTHIQMCEHTHTTGHTQEQKVPLAHIHASTNIRIISWHPKHTHRRPPISKHEHPVV